MDRQKDMRVEEETGDEETRAEQVSGGDDRCGYSRDEGPNANKRAVCLFSDERTVAILSDLVAMLERARYDDRPKGRKVLMTKWGRSLFQNCLNDEMRRDFDVDDWFELVAGPSPSSDGFIDPSLWNAEIVTDWVGPLLYLETKSPGFITMLHGIKTVEVRSQLKFNNYRTLHSTGDDYGLAPAPAAPPPPTQTTTGRGRGQVRNDAALEWRR